VTSYTKYIITILALFVEIKKKPTGSVVLAGTWELLLKSSAAELKKNQIGILPLKECNNPST
jgi:hypothetical protein